MIPQALAGFAAALLLTIVVEAAAAWLLGLRTGQAQLILLLINVITNPLLNLALTLANALGLFTVVSPYDPVLLVLEAIVIATETLLLVQAVKLPRNQALLITLVANTASWLAGALLLW